MQRREFLSLLGSLTVSAGAFSLLGCQPGEVARSSTHRPNILVLISDDHSVPDLGCYGNDALETPNLDRLASEGIRFNRAYVDSPQCSPSRASLLTGRTPHAAGASRLHADILPEIPDVVKLLKSQGYYTGGYKKIHQDRIKQEFDYYGGARARFPEFFNERPKNKPFLLWFGSLLPHRPYGRGTLSARHRPEEVHVPDYLPDTLRVRKDLARYYQKIEKFDTQCGKFLDLLEQEGEVENTMVIMLGDNGLPFPRGKGTLYEPGINVPLIIRWPGVVEPGQVSDALVSVVDLTATWFEAANIDPPPNIQGRSLLPLLQGEQSRVRKHAYSERNWHDNWDPMRCVVGDRYKLIQNYRPQVGYQPTIDIRNSPSYKSIQQLGKRELPERLDFYFADSRPHVELYDLQEDPHEWNNLAEKEEYVDLVLKYQKQLSEWMEATNDFLPPPRSAFPEGPHLRMNRRIDPLNGTRRTAS